MIVFKYFIFPGLLFSLFIGGILWWIERKLTARFQYRVGPVWYQNFIDVMKLFLKETIIPLNANKLLFVLSPLVAFSVMGILSIIMGEIYFFGQGIWADILVILYLLIIPSLCLILGALSSANPLSITGASREIKMMLSYEFIFICSLVIAIIKSGGVISLSQIINHQEIFGPNLASISGFIGFTLGIFYIMAKLGIVPFDMAEAEQEIMGGPLIEYSGVLLGFFKLTKMLGYYVLSLLIISLFWPVGGWRLVYKFITIILLISVIKNVNPRLRMKDSMRFFWFLLFPLGVFGIILSLLGY